MPELGVRSMTSNSVAGNGEIQRQNNFEIYIEDLVTLTGTIDDFYWFVKSFPLPKEKSESIVLKHGNAEVKFAGGVSYEDSELVIYDSIALDGEKRISLWRGLVYDKEKEAVGLANIYKKTMYVTQYAPDGTVERKWRYEGVWPKEVSYGDLDVEKNADFKQISITLCYDRAVRE